MSTEVTVTVHSLNNAGHTVATIIYDHNSIPLTTLDTTVAFIILLVTLFTSPGMSHEELLWNFCVLQRILPELLR
jgi:hypothetical protein